VASITELEQWDDELYQLETTDPVIGGPNGISNQQAKTLGNRTRYLKQQVELRAPLATPTFTGEPKAPTAVQDTSTQQIATTEFVVAQASDVSPLMDGIAAVGTSKRFSRQDHVHPADKKAAPSGEVSYFAMSTAPTGWLKCNGAAISRTTYADLFVAIGTTFGSGDGSTTFNLPDLRGEFLRGYDDGRGVDLSRVFGSAQNATEVGPIIGAQGSPTRMYINISNSDGDGGVNSTWIGYTGTSAGTIGNTYQKVRPRNMAMLACIKY